jgi:hypothetical protein
MRKTGSHRLNPGAGRSNAGGVGRLRWISGEVSGAFGDLGIFLPYVVAAVGVGILAPGPVFFGFAAGYLLVAVVYRVPVAVQPMKALGALIIAGGLGASETAWAGAIIGVVLLMLAALPALDRAARAIPQSVVTGLQAGLGLMLATVAWGLLGEDWSLAVPALAVLGLSLIWMRGPWVIAVVVAAVLFFPAAGPATTEITPIHVAGSVTAVLSGVAGQLVLTLLNAVVVAAAVARALYPAAASTVSERRLAASSGLLNLALVPFGAMPMCHGAGGMAAHHRFGARGWGAPLVMASCCGAAALAGPGSVALLASVPPAVVGALLVYAAVDLVWSPRLRDARPDCRPVIAATALATVALGPLAGLGAGLAGEALRVHLVRRKAPARGTGSR